MAITRTDINGDITALKAALETLVPDFFASVEYDDATTPTGVICKDADGNTIFKAGKASSSNYFSYAAYKNAETAQETSASGASPKYMYKVGGNGAVLETTGPSFVIIAKTNIGTTGFALPDTMTVVSSIKKAANYHTACWGDDPALTDGLVFGTASDATANNGNHTLFVPIPMHGTYSEQIYLPKAFFMPMAQNGMRGAVQELSTDSGTYLTNGYVALLDDSAVN